MQSITILFHYVWKKDCKGHCSVMLYYIYCSRITNESKKRIKKHDILVDSILSDNNWIFFTKSNMEHRYFVNKYHFVYLQDLM